MKLTGENRSSRRETCPSATLSTTNPTCTDPGSNPGLRVERPATNRLNVLHLYYLQTIMSTDQHKRLVVVTYCTDPTSISNSHTYDTG